MTALFAKPASHWISYEDLQASYEAAVAWWSWPMPPGWSFPKHQPLRRPSVPAEFEHDYGRALAFQCWEWAMHHAILSAFDGNRIQELQETVDSYIRSINTPEFKRFAYDPSEVYEGVLVWPLISRRDASALRQYHAESPRPVGLTGP